MFFTCRNWRMRLQRNWQRTTWCLCQRQIFLWSFAPMYPSAEIRWSQLEHVHCGAWARCSLGAWTPSSKSRLLLLQPQSRHLLENCIQWHLFRVKTFQNLGLLALFRRMVLPVHLFPVLNFPAFAKDPLEEARVTHCFLLQCRCKGRSASQWKHDRICHGCTTEKRTTVPLIPPFRNALQIEMRQKTQNFWLPSDKKVATFLQLGHIDNRNASCAGGSNSTQRMYDDEVFYGHKIS